MEKSTFSLSIMAHPSREKYFRYLKDKLGNVPFSIDTGFGIWENRKRATLMYDKNAKFHIVLQDDAIIGKNFIKNAENILKDSDMAYSFYFGNRKSFKKIGENGLADGKIVSEWLNWGLAICVPTKIIPEMIDYCDKMKIKNDDTRIAKFLRKKLIKICYPIPSLIEHRQDEESLVGDVRGRKAMYFIGE